MKRVAEYITAFITVGSWCSIMVMLFFSDQFASDTKVVLAIIGATLSGSLAMIILLILALRSNAFKYPKTCLILISMAAIGSNVWMFMFNSASIRMYKNVRVEVVEKGVRKSKRKMPNGGRYFEIKSPFGQFELQVSECEFESRKVGDALQLDFEIGRLNFVKIDR